MLLCFFCVFLCFSGDFWWRVTSFGHPAAGLFGRQNLLVFLAVPWCLFAFLGVFAGDGWVTSFHRLSTSLFLGQCHDFWLTLQSFRVNGARISRICVCFAEAGFLRETGGLPAP